MVRRAALIILLLAPAAAETATYAATETATYAATETATYAGTETATYAVVEGHGITDVDVIAAVGYVPSSAAGLAKVVEGLVERKIILGLAERKGITCTDTELDRTLALIAKTRGANNVLPADDYRRYVREEIIIGKYVDEYIYPTVDISDEQLERLFLLIPGEFVKPVPATRTRLEEIFPAYRNEVYNRYVKIEVARLLREEIEAVEDFIEIKYHIDTDKK
jgi:hypothetical protein